MKAIYALLCLGFLSACNTTSAVSVTAGLDMCNDYQSSINCFGKPYRMVTSINGDINLHEGMDFRIGAGTPVISASYGTVLNQSFYPCGGYKVTVESDVTMPGGKPLYVSYAHLKWDSAMVENGAMVKPGDVIGHIAEVTKKDECQGFSHVHFFVHTGLRAATHTSPHPYWRDAADHQGDAKFSCYDPNNVVPGKLTAPLACRKVAPRSTL